MISVRGLAKRFGSTHVLQGLALEVPAGGSVGILGASGTGKTTLLRLLAGLEIADAGEIHLCGRPVDSPTQFVPPHARGLGVVFQRPALWPHLSLGANILFGVLSRQRAERRGRLERLLVLLELSGLAERRPHELSEGQARRAALARALAPEPPVLLLDEPFTNLDSELRARLVAAVRAEAHRFGATTVLVTHEPAEAVAFAADLQVLEHGVLHPRPPGATADSSRGRTAARGQADPRGEPPP